MHNDLRNPYPGPRPFRSDECSVFAGRDHEISELPSLIISHQVVLLYGPSGIGKTSLLNAGIAPRLKQKGVRLLPISRVGLPAPPHVRSGDIRNVYTFSALGDLIQDTPHQDDWYLTAQLGDALARIPKLSDEVGEPALRVLAFDQFEEIFTTSPERWRDKLAFFLQIAEAVAQESTLRVVFLLREEYLGAFGEFADILPGRVRARYRLQPLRGREALNAINCPLEGSRWSFEENVAETLIKDLMTTSVEAIRGRSITVPGEFVEPVQLQVVCFTLLECLPREKTKITLQDLHTFGNPDAALRSFYEEGIRRAVAHGCREERLRSWFDTRLITSAGTRGLVFQAKDGAEGIASKIITVLEDQHLIRAEIRSGSRWLELTHDRFIGPIRESNALWRRRRLRYSLIAAATGLVLLVAAVLWSTIQTRARVTAADIKVQKWETQASDTKQGAKLVQRVAQSEATALLKDAIQTHSGRAQTLANLALAQCMLGDPDSANQLLAQALDTDALAAMDVINGSLRTADQDQLSTGALSACRHSLLMAGLLDQQVISSKPVHDYICANNYLVIVSSGMPGPRMNGQLQVWRERYPEAVITNQPQDNANVGIAVASFTTLDDAKRLLQEIRTKYGTTPYIGLESRKLQPSCK